MFPGRARRFTPLPASLRDADLPLKGGGDRSTRHADADAPEPATLVLRVEGPVAIEIQHLSGVIVERVNRFFGWRAISRIALRQAPLMFRDEARPVAAPSAERTAAIAATLTDVADADLRQALARLGAAIKRT